MLNIGTESSDFFQTSAEIEKENLRSKKISNTLGDPFRIGAKIICIKPIISPLLESSPSILLTDGGYMCRIFDPVNRKVTIKFKGHKGPVPCVTYYHDREANDTYIFTGSWDKTVIQWSLKSGELLRQFYFHTQFVKCVALDPAKKFLYSGSQDKTIRKLELSTEHCEVWTGHTMGINEIITTDAFVFTCGSDATIRQWDANTGTCLKTIEAHETGVHGLLLDEDALWSASPDKSVKKWSLERLETPESTFEHPDSVKAMVLLHSGALATGCRDEKIRIWDLMTDKVIKVIDGHCDEVSSLCVIGGNLYSGSYDGTLRTWLIKDLLDPTVSFDYLEVTEEVVPKPLKRLTAEEEDELNVLMEETD